MKQKVQTLSVDLTAASDRAQRFDDGRLPGVAKVVFRAAAGHRVGILDPEDPEQAVVTWIRVTTVYTTYYPCLDPGQIAETILVHGTPVITARTIPEGERRLKLLEALGHGTEEIVKALGRPQA